MKRIDTTYAWCAAALAAGLSSCTGADGMESDGFSLEDAEEQGIELLDDALEALPDDSLQEGTDSLHDGAGSLQERADDSLQGVADEAARVAEGRATAPHDASLEDTAAAEAASPLASCTRRSGPFAWHCAGPLPSMSCTQILEGADPHTWNDNFFCSETYLGMRWSSAGPIHGMACTQIFEYADPYTWLDNYLCVPPRSAYHFIWSQSGPLPGSSCVQWLEPSDPHTWNDNYLCAIRTR